MATVERGDSPVADERGGLRATDDRGVLAVADDRIEATTGPPDDHRPGSPPSIEEREL